MLLTVEAIRAAGYRALIFPAGIGATHWYTDEGLGWPAVAAAEVLGRFDHPSEWRLPEKPTSHSAVEQLTRLIRFRFSNPNLSYLEWLSDDPKQVGQALLDIADEMERKENKCNSQ